MGKDALVVISGGGPILLCHLAIVGNTTMDFSSGFNQWTQGTLWILSVYTLGCLMAPLFDLQ